MNQSHQKIIGFSIPNFFPKRLCRVSEICQLTRITESPNSDLQAALTLALLLPPPPPDGDACLRWRRRLARCHSLAPTSGGEVSDFQSGSHLFLVWLPPEAAEVAGSKWAPDRTIFDRQTFSEARFRECRRMLRETWFFGPCLHRWPHPATKGRI